MADTGENGAVHTITFALEHGYERWTMQCPFDLADTSRPCWPQDDDGKPSEFTTAQFCNWREWFDNDGIESTEDFTLPPLPVVNMTWDGSAPTFTVAAPSATEALTDGT